MNINDNNMTGSHPDQDLMSLFVKTTMLAESGTIDKEKQAVFERISMNSIQYHEILDHLAICESCRKQVDVLIALHEGWGDIQQDSDLDEMQQESICLYIEDSLKADDKEEVKTLIETNPAALRSALHYLSHTSEMNDEQGAVATRFETEAAYARETSGTGGESGPTGLLHNIYSSLTELFSLRTPLIYSMAVTSGIVIAVMLLLQSPELDRSQTMIATYQDNPGIQFTEENTLPGIGFFTQSRHSTMPFDDISIELVSENVIRISWPVIDGAELYKMRIQVFNNGNKTVLKEISTHENHTRFELEDDPQQSAESTDRYNRRYEWILYGNTEDDRMFYTSGGFVVDTIRPETSR